MTGRLMGENIWEPEPRKAQIIKLAPADVMTTHDADRLLAPFIKPLPSFAEMVAGLDAGARIGRAARCDRGATRVHL
jgi:hypothetical protein